MVNNLQSAIFQRAQSFAADILHAVRSAPLEEILAEGAARPNGAGRPASRAVASPRKRGERLPRVASRAPVSSQKAAERLPRRSKDELAKTAASVAQLLKGVKDGMRAEDIRHKLGLDVREVPRALKDALASKLISKKGQKRATTYFYR